MGKTLDGLIAEEKKKDNDGKDDELKEFSDGDWSTSYMKANRESWKIWTGNWKEMEKLRLVNWNLMH